MSKETAGHFTRAAVKLGWTVNSQCANTGSVYLDLKKGDEDIRIRFSDHPAEQQNFDYEVLGNCYEHLRGVINPDWV